MRPEHATSTPTSRVVFGTRDGSPVVLKVVTEPHEEWNAGKVVSAFAGHGMVRALEHVPGAVLLDAVRPGTPLSTRFRAGQDRAATKVVATVIEAMLEVAPETAGHATAESWAVAFDGYLDRGDGEISTGFVQRARETYLALCRTQGPVRLLHGDLHHGNILLDEKRGWLAVDPKGVVAEIEFELGSPLRNPFGHPELDRPSFIRRRAGQYARALAVDPDRVMRWAFAQAVLSAIWMVQDGERLAPDAPVLSFALAAAALIE